MRPLTWNAIFISPVEQHGDIIIEVNSAGENNIDDMLGLGRRE